MKNYVFANIFFIALACCSELFAEGKFAENEQHAFCDAMRAPFEIDGFPWRTADGHLLRLPLSARKQSINGRALFLSVQSAGGVFRFKCAARKIVLKAHIKALDYPQCTRALAGGFDLYRKNVDGGGRVYLHTFRPSQKAACGTEAIFETVSTHTSKKCVYEIYLPIFSEVKSLEIGTCDGTEISPVKIDRNSKPILFYGSSVTQGAFASRPALTWTNLVCAALGMRQINMGFSGSAFGEPELAEIIAGLEIAALVMEYDYNTPTNGVLLARTHEAFFKKIRMANPHLPVLFISRCMQRSQINRDIVRSTYLNAVKAGDENVAFIDGASFFAECGDDVATCDNWHPNDYGAHLMVEKIVPVLKSLLKIK